MHFNILKNWKKITLVTIALVSGCAHQPTPHAIDPPGFFSGVFHGFIICFSFIASLFTDVRIYAFPNSGGWYDFGFLIGIILLFGIGLATD